MERNAKRKAMHLTKKSLHKLAQSSSIEDDGVEDDGGEADEDYDGDVGEVMNSDNSSCSIGTYQ